jgi:hypothetical protein
MKADKVEGKTVWILEANDLYVARHFYECTKCVCFLMLLILYNYIS